MLRFCPNCGENLAQYTSSAPAKVITQPKYNQTQIWKELVELAESHRANPPGPEALVLPVLEKSASIFDSGAPVRSVIHMVFDRAVVPQGGVLQQLALSEGKVPISDDRLELSGYVVEDGKVQMVNDIPIGEAYRVIDYWGGERQHKRWHLAKPVSLNPSRHGDPYFMDDNMVAFGAKWGDAAHIQSALLELMDLFINGVGGAGVVGVPIGFAVFWQTDSTSKASS